MATYDDERGYIRHSNLISREKAKEQIWEKNRDKFPLPFSEYIVHHRDMNKKNNNLANLQLITSKEHNKLHMKQSKKINWIYESRVGKSILFIIMGLILALKKEDMTSSRTIGVIIIIFSALSLIHEIQLHYRVKKSKNANEIKNSSHSLIANYFERNNIKYIYMPKEEKDFEFFLPEYESYVKYWENPLALNDRNRIKKNAEKYALKFVEIFYDKIYDLKTLHGSFMKRLSEQLKKR